MKKQAKNLKNIELYRFWYSSSAKIEISNTERNEIP